MTRHFFEVDELDSLREERLRKVFEASGGGSGGRKITPAMVEQLAGEFDTLDGFIEAMESLPPF